MTLIDRCRSSALFIDMQERLVPEVDLGDLVALMCERSMTWLRGQRVGVVVTEHCLDELGNTVFEVAETTTRLDKTAGSVLKGHSI